MPSRSLFLSFSLCLAAGVATGRAAEPQWFKGNLHTHSLWSDGNNYPEMIADWYKQNGYHFLSFTEHDRAQAGVRWLELKRQFNAGQQRTYELGGEEILENYLKRFGADWVELRQSGDKREVRLKPLVEYRGLLEEPGRFLLLSGEEVTGRWRREKTATTPEHASSTHINIINLAEPLRALEGGTSALQIMEHTTADARGHRASTAQPTLALINHPNFGWGVTAEELATARQAAFFEIYNGHQLAFNAGDAEHLSVDAIWDAALTLRLAQGASAPLYAIATDDSHNWREWGVGKSNAGRGWIVVRARHLTPESIARAMEAGDFYASSGVQLAKLERGPNHVALEVATEPGVTYTVQFIGTRRGYDATSQLIPASPDRPQRTLPHRRYSRDVGAVLAETKGPVARYTFKGDELYVRAKIISSKPKANGAEADEFECAWVQPLFPAKR